MRARCPECLALIDSCVCEHRAEDEVEVWAPRRELLRERGVIVVTDENRDTEWMHKHLCRATLIYHHEERRR